MAELKPGRKSEWTQQHNIFHTRILFGFAAKVQPYILLLVIPTQEESIFAMIKG